MAKSLPCLWDIRGEPDEDATRSGVGHGPDDENATRHRANPRENGDEHEPDYDDRRDALLAKISRLEAKFEKLSMKAEQHEQNLSEIEDDCSVSSKSSRHKITWIDRMKEPVATSTPMNRHAAGSLPNVPQMFTFQPLPTLQLNVFDGDPVNWPEWSLNFRNLIHDNATLTQDQKLGYLRNYLGKGPRSKIYGYLLEGKNYQLALVELQERYGNPIFIIEAFVKKVRSWSKLKGSSDIGPFCTQVTQLIQLFKTMGYNSDLSSYGLLSELTAKLPDSMRESWGGYVVRFGAFEPTVELFHEWLVKKEQALRYGGITEQPASGKLNKNETKRSGNGGGGSSGGKSATNPTILSQTANERSDTPTCIFCSGKHWLNDCRDFERKSPAERLQWYKSEGRCFLCSKKFHRTRDCVSKYRCRVGGCGKRHCALLHRSFVLEEPTADPDKTHVCASVRSGAVYLQTLPVRVHAPNGRIVETYAMIDAGSQATLIQESFAKEIGLNGPVSMLSLGNIQNNPPKQKSKRVSFWVSDPQQPSMPPIKVRNAWTFGSPFNLPSQHIPVNDQGNVEWSHLEGLGLRTIESSQIMVLIGADTKNAMVQLEIRQGPEHLPMAVRTPLGWTVMGAADLDDEGVDQVVNPSVNIVRLNDDQLEKQVERFWSTESFGCAYDSDEPLSLNDRKALDILDSTVKKVDGHYEVAMLWSEPDVKLINNRYLAERRFDSLSRKLNSNDQMRSRYEKVVNGYIEKGYARRMSEAEISSVSDCTYYLPHHGVTNPHKPEKLRVVYDAAATYRGCSLNSRLLTGPDLVNSLQGVLMRFRKGVIAMAADIEGMFHQVAVPPSDRDSLRFLWKEDMSQPGPPDLFQKCVHIFGAKSSPCCASYCLRRVAEDATEEFSLMAREAILRNFYVDDMLKALDSVPSSISLALELIKLTATGGFKLTEWTSNCKEVLDAVSNETGIKTRLNLDLENNCVVRTLGMACDMKLDIFVYDLLPLECTLTKRGILSAVSTIFDPLGLLAPFVLRAKLLLQSLWEKGLDWDEEIDEYDKETWTSWVEELSMLSSFRLRRCYWTENFTPLSFSLHMFSDASEKAFGSVGYLRMVSTLGNVHVSIVVAKTRVAPVSKARLTLPRLELQAAVLSVRLHCMIRKELDIRLDATYFWTDSNIVLHYIANETKRFKTFVANRVAEIRCTTAPDQWHFVPGTDNPADDCSRGLNASDIDSEHRWLRGPDYLWLDPSHWPQQPPVCMEFEEADCELKRVVALSTVEPMEAIVDPAKYSSLVRLQRVTAWCFRFVHNLRSQPANRNHSGLSASELDDSMSYLVKLEQQRYFAKEIDCLASGKCVPRGSPLSALTPVLVNGILRVGGRIENAKLPYHSRHQILLPKNSYVARLVIELSHKQVLHSGLEHTIARVRQRFWIPAIRPLVNKVLRDCILCHRRRVQPLVPQMAQLPSARLAEFEPVFTETGLDYFGPLNVKRGRGTEKRWGCIFTCLTVRAVHLELVSSLETDSFILALRRFIARRGTPKEIFSDNGTNFVGADRELGEAVQAWNENEKMRNYVSQKGIKWIRIPPRSPHMGGAWERLVKSVKVALKAVLGNQCVHEDTLHSTLCEIEAVLNSRPLTYSSSDIHDFEPLMPNHFLLHSFQPIIPPTVTGEVDVYSRKRWRQSQLLIDHFWRRWKREYLPTLTVTSKWRTEVPNITVGDLVMVMDKMPRVVSGRWHV